MKSLLLLATAILALSSAPFTAPVKAAAGADCCGCCTGGSCGCTQCTCCDCATCATCSK